MGLCNYCQRDCWEHTFSPGHGWETSHQKCRPHKPRVERRRTAEGKAPMGYVPSNYEIEKAPSESMGRAIEWSKARGE